MSWIMVSVGQANYNATGKTLRPFPCICKCTKFPFSGPNATQLYRHNSKRCLPPSGRWGWVFRRRTSLPCPWTNNLRTWDCGCRRPWPLWWGQPWCGRRECSSSPWTDSQHKSTKQKEKLRSINSHICLLLLTSKTGTSLLNHTIVLRVLMPVSLFRTKKI